MIIIYTNVIGVVVYISDVHDNQCSWRRSSRHIAIINTSLHIVIIHVRSPHISRHAGEWRPAEQSFRTIAAVHVKKNRTRGVLTTTRYSKIVFSPNRQEADEMEGFRNRLLYGPSRARQLASDHMLDMNVLSA